MFTKTIEKDSPNDCRGIFVRKRLMRTHQQDSTAYHRSMLILFDIDGTLLLTQRAGAAAMVDAGRELFGEHFTLDGIEISGRLDPLIWADAAKAAAIENADDKHNIFRSTYAAKLQKRLDRDRTATLCPGVTELITALHTTTDITLGLLTGNYPETGRLKIAAAGLDADIFTIAAWGCDGAHRRELPPIAAAQFQQRHGRSIDAGHTIIIGDTPHDVDCAHHNGCLCIAVATGMFSINQLRDAGADLVVNDLSDTAMLLDWLSQSRQPISQ